MNIVFYCHSCGARFDVPASTAGKRGRCKKCGQLTTIPRAEDVASMVALPALAPVGATPAPTTAPSWIATASSNVGLAPLTVDRLPIGRLKPVKARTKWDDDPDDAKPYTVLAERTLDHRGPVGRPVSGAKILWRKELGVVQKVFRWLNETAYLVSVPFLMLIVIGAISRSRSMALLGATVVVVLNLGRIVAGLANLVVIPFRDGITQGVLFLVPPLTFFYLANHWKKVRKPTLRILGPIATIALVVVAFTFVPSLGGKPAAPADLQGRLVEGAKGLEKEIEGEVSKAKSLDVKTLEAQAGSEARKLRDQIRPGPEDAAPASKSSTPEDAVGGLLRGVGKRARETIEESGKAP